MRFGQAEVNDLTLFQIKKPGHPWAGLSRPLAPQVDVVIKTATHHELNFLVVVHRP